MKKSTVALSAAAAVLAAGLCCTTGLLIRNAAESQNTSDISNVTESASGTEIPDESGSTNASESQKPAETASGSTAALTPKPLSAKAVDENPYMAGSGANIHHDCCNTDSSDEIFPLGIYPEVNVSYEKQNANASPAIFFDTYGHSVVPLLGGIAIRDINAEIANTIFYADNGAYPLTNFRTALRVCLITYLLGIKISLPHLTL